jgi:hypothetical protein
MNSTSPFIASIRSAFEHPARGLLGAVDDLLMLCHEHGVVMDWSAGQCRVQAFGAGVAEQSSWPLPKPVFRAVLARIAQLCNGHAPNSVSPYGGEGELVIDTKQRFMLKAKFTNTPEEQRLELIPLRDGVQDQDIDSQQSSFRA